MEDRSGASHVTPSAFSRLESLTAVTVVGVLAVALALAALVMPATKSETRKVEYTQTGAFSYAADAPDSSVLGSDGVTTGEPIIGGLVDDVDVRFRYTLESKASAAVDGSAALDAVVTVDQGLSRVFRVAPEEDFTGTEHTVSGRLPIEAMTRYVAAAGRQFPTGVSGSVVTLRPRIDLVGTLDGHPVKESYDPTLSFGLTGDTLTLPARDPEAGGANPLEPSEAGSAGHRVEVANTMPLLILNPPVHDAMMAGAFLAGLSLLLGLWLARPLLQRNRGGGEAARIRALYGALLVEVDDVSLKNGPVADVVGIESLVDVAKRYESMIMHVGGPDGDAYLVWDNGILYRYRPRRVVESLPTALRGAGQGHAAG